MKYEEPILSYIMPTADDIVKTSGGGKIPDFEDENVDKDTWL